jgi:hypothetical protein
VSLLLGTREIIMPNRRPDLSARMNAPASLVRLPAVACVMTLVARLAIGVWGVLFGTPISAAEPQAAPPARDRPRTIVTQDGEVDDMDSFIRFLYYANEFDLAGIVYSSSRFHWAGNGEDVEPYRWTGTEWVNTYIDEYEKVYPNLIQHATGYPTADELRALYKIGNISNVGEMNQVTEGSEWVKRVILDTGPGPLYVQVWGGLNTVARALRSIEEVYCDSADWSEIAARVNNKLIIYNILTQDSTLEEYIRPNWPGVRIIDNQRQFGSFAYQWQRRVPEPFRPSLGGGFMKANFLDGHGGLLGNYRTFGDGKPTLGDAENHRWDPARLRGLEQYSFISEGDSPAFMHLLDFNGLRARENPTWGGWGGRFKPTDYGWLDTQDFNTFTGESDRSCAQTRWVEDIQNDFAARADWGVMSFEEANHNPVASVAEGLEIIRAAGAEVVLHGAATDPDGDAVRYRWWVYREAGTYAGAVELNGADVASMSFRVPKDASPGETIHLILDAQDDGSPPLKHYQRVIVTVEGESPARTK